jgi:multicomponent K+:H+ antiporter subunit G
MHLGWNANELPRPSPGRNWATFAAPDQASLVDRRDARDKSQPGE